MENFGTIKKFIINNDIGLLSINELAELTFTSTSAITRFCQKEGFGGFKDMKSFYSSKRNFFDKAENLAYSLSRTRNNLSYGSIKYIAKKIYEKDNVYILGEGFTKELATTFNRKLRKINIDSKVIDIGSDEGNIITKQNSMYIFISNSGRNKNVKITANKIINGSKKEDNISIVSISSNGYSNISSIANETLIGYSQVMDESLERQVPSANQIVNQFILDEIYEWIFNEKEHENKNLLQIIVYEKEKKLK